MLQQIASAETERAATTRRDTFARTYRPYIPKAAERLECDWERLVAYYAFPQEHWRHLRTTIVIESPFAAGSAHTTAAKSFNKVAHATALIWKMLLVVEQHFRKPTALHLCRAVPDGTVYRDGQQAITPNPKAAVRLTPCPRLLTRAQCNC